MIKLLQDRKTTESNLSSPIPSTLKESLDTSKNRQPRKSLNVSGPVQAYVASLKNFWFPVAFSEDLKGDTMVSLLPGNSFFPFQLVSKEQLEIYIPYKTQH